MSGTDITEESRIPASLSSEQQPHSSDDLTHASKDESQPQPATPTELVPGKKRAREEDSQNGDATPDSSTQPMSKNQLKRLRRQEAWAAAKEDRKIKRKDKRHEKQARKREELQSKIEEAKAAGLNPVEVLKEERERERAKKETKHNPVPVAFIVDCDFERYMRDPEVISLSSQVVRSYSMNRTARYQAHFLVSSFGGKMKERFETVLNNNHLKWRGVRLVEGDFVEAAREAKELMSGPKAGEIPDVLKPRDGDERDRRDATASAPVPGPESDDIDRSVVYLTSDSPYTLERLEPYTSYVIGGIVDRNREKGLCYKKAVQRKVRTAKLPIGEYMAMQSRFVLTTNQVVEIMARWLECGDWGKAFLNVIPQRKGGVLKGQGSETGYDDSQDMEEGDKADTVDGEGVTMEKDPEQPANAAEAVLAAAADSKEQI